MGVPGHHRVSRESLLAWPETWGRPPPFAAQLGAGCKHKCTYGGCWCWTKAEQHVSVMLNKWSYLAHVESEIKGLPQSFVLTKCGPRTPPRSLASQTVKLQDDLSLHSRLITHQHNRHARSWVTYCRTSFQGSLHSWVQAQHLSVHVSVLWGGPEDTKHLSTHQSSPSAPEPTPYLVLWANGTGTARAHFIYLWKSQLSRTERKGEWGEPGEDSTYR